MILRLTSDFHPSRSSREIVNCLESKSQSRGAASTGTRPAIDRPSTARADPAGVRSVAIVPILGAAVVLAVAGQVAFGHATPVGEPDGTVGAAVLDPVASIPLGVIPISIAATPEEVWVTAGGAGVIRVDARTGVVVARIRTGGAVIAALAQRALWAVDVSNDLLVEIDRGQQRVARETAVDGLPTAVAAAAGRLWAVGQQRASVTVVDAYSLRRVGVLGFEPAELWPGAIVSGPRGIWLLTGWRGEVTLIDAKTLAVVARVPTPSVDALATAGGSVWASRVAENGAGLVRIDPWSLAVIVVDLHEPDPVTALTGAASLYVAVPGALLELDAVTGETIARTRISRRYRITALASAGRELWAADETSGALLRFRLPPVARRERRYRRGGLTG
jgi:hypothetical protein